MRGVLCKKSSPLRNEAKSVFFFFFRVRRRGCLMRCVLCKKARVLLMCVTESLERNQTKSFIFFRVRRCFQWFEKRNLVNQKTFSEN